VIGRLGKPVDLTGGETLLDPDLLSTARDLQHAGATLGSVFTNGTLIRRRRSLIEELGKLAPKLRFFVSLDGDQSAHDALRGLGTFEAALGGATLLKTMGFPVFVNTMLHADVTRDSVVRLYHTMVERGFDRWRLDSPFNAGAWTVHREAHELDHNVRIDLLAEVVSRWAGDGMRFELEAGHVLKYLGQTIYFLDNYRVDDPVCPCRILPVWPNGDVSWCQDLSDPEYIVGNLLRDSLSEVYANYAPYKTRTIGEVARINGVCQDCRLLTHCGAGCRIGALGNGGAFDDPDPGACSLYRSRAYQPVAEALRHGLAIRVKA
jgi:radical SAM protein with 4Fe4S-binding SPASM domain